MLSRKIEKNIREHLNSSSNKILIVDGARQIGKSYIIRYVGKDMFPNYIEINLLEDSLGPARFANVRTIQDFYFQVSTIAGNKMKSKQDTLIFLDEIQVYPHLLTLLKFLREDDRYTYIASGSILGVTLAETSSIPIGSISLLHMYPLDFEEFLYANNFNELAIKNLKKKYERKESLDENAHNLILSLFKKYLLIGGLPDAVNAYIKDFNIVNVRSIQSDIHSFYAADAAKYDKERRLKIRRIYEMIPSTLENRKKRIRIKNIDNIDGKSFSNYQDEFDYLINSGIALETKAISSPTFPLIESSGKNLLKLYMNDVGILTSILFNNNADAIMTDQTSINLGSVYENVVASELKAHGRNLYYYDNRNNGEVDFLIDDYDTLSVLPIEVKSGKDYMTHRALNRFVSNESYNIKKAYVLSNERNVSTDGKITYLPIYYVMFI